MNTREKIDVTSLYSEEFALHKIPGMYLNVMLSNDKQAMNKYEVLSGKYVVSPNFQPDVKLYFLDGFYGCSKPYFKYSTIMWRENTVNELFWSLFYYNIPMLYKIKCATFLFNRDIQYHRKIALLEELSSIGVNTAERLPLDILSHLTDTLINCGLPEFVRSGEQLLIVLRRREAVEGVRNNIMNGKKIKLIYDDTQNVHNTHLNQEVLKGVLLLCQDKYDEKVHQYDTLLKQFGDVSTEIVGELEKFKMMNNKITDVLYDIGIDFALFTSNRIRIRDILIKVWHRYRNVCSESGREAFLQRLSQELTDMAGVCSTGKMSRVVNVLNGLPISDGGLNLRMVSWQDQITANIFARLNKCIQNLTDEKVQEDIIVNTSKSNPSYVSFVKGVRNDIYQSMHKEFLPIFTQQDSGLNEKQFTALFDACVISLIGNATEIKEKVESGLNGEKKEDK